MIRARLALFFLAALALLLLLLAPPLPGRNLPLLTTLTLLSIAVPCAVRLLAEALRPEAA